MPPACFICTPITYSHSVPPNVPQARPYIKHPQIILTYKSSNKESALCRDMPPACLICKLTDYSRLAQSNVP